MTLHCSRRHVVAQARMLASGATEIARVLFVLFMVLFLVSIIGGAVRQPPV